MNIVRETEADFSLDSFEIEHLRENLPVIGVCELTDFEAFHLGLIDEDLLFRLRTELL